MVCSVRSRVTGCVGLLVAAATVVGHGQEFRSGVEMVALSVTVLDGRGHSVDGLTAADFAVFEDGVPQTVSLFGSDEVPLDVALILDSSASMGELMPVVKAGARSLLSRLRDGDRATLIDLKRTIAVRQDLTSDLPQVTAAVDAVEPGGTTALYDGLYLALRQFEHARRQHPDRRRQALVVFSDGVDTASRLDFTSVAELARSADVAIYTITPDNRRTAWVGARLEQRQSAMWELRTLTRELGAVQRFARRMVDPANEPAWKDLPPLMADTSTKARAHALDISNADLFKSTPHVSAIVDMSRDYDAKVDHFLEMIHAGKLAEANHYNVEILRPTYDNYQITLDAAADFVESQGNNLRDRYTQDSRFFGGLLLAFAGWPVIAAGVAVFVLALLIITLLVTIFAPEFGWSKRGGGGNAPMK